MQANNPAEGQAIWVVVLSLSQEIFQHGGKPLNVAPNSQRTSRFITSGDVQIHALDWGGDGTPLLLVHGARRTGRSWNAVARRLQNDFRVIAIDVRGHGDSGATGTGNDCLGRMRDFDKVALELNLGAHFVMAHSIGCAPAALYASHHAQRVIGLILIEPIPDVHTFWTRGETSKEVWVQKSVRARNGWESIDELRSRIERNVGTRRWDPEVLEDILREETRLFPDGRVEIKLNPSIHNLDEMWEDRTDLIAEAPNIDMPTLVLARADNPQLETSLKRLTDALPQGRIDAISDIGHSMYMENPSLISDIGRKFFAPTA